MVDSHIENGAEEIKNKILSVWNSIKFGSAAWRFDGRMSEGSKSPVVLLGETYSSEDSFSRDFISKLWLTYRREFKEFSGTRINTDCGWGCMIRSGQMLIGNALLLLHLGRSWRWKMGPHTPPLVTGEDLIQESTHRSIVKLFGDNETSPLSIHALLYAAGRLLNRKPGDWFGPSSTARLLKTLVTDSSHPLLSELVVYVADDCTVYSRDVEDLCIQSSLRWKPVIILVPLRLGGEKLNPIYGSVIKSLLAMENCVGIIGGRPKHSLYFIGFQDDNLIHLDPHLVQDQVDIFRKQFDLKTFHCNTPKKMSLAKMDPSCCFGFLCTSRKQFETWRVIVMRLAVPEGTSYPMFSVLEGKASDIFRTDFSRAIGAGNEEFVNVSRHPSSSNDGEQVSEDFIFV